MSSPQGKKNNLLLGAALACVVVGGAVILLLSNQAPSAAPTIITNTQHSDPNLQELLSKASIQRGHMMAHTCNDCHTFDEGGPHRFGPNLFGIFGAHHASKNDFAYSEALKAQHDKVWDEERLYSWLMNPKAYVPGTKMGYPGVSSAQDRADIIAYLKTLKAE